MWARLICCTFSPDSGSGEGREGAALINAPRPLPRPDFAIAAQAIGRARATQTRGSGTKKSLRLCHSEPAKHGEGPRKQRAASIWREYLSRPVRSPLRSSADRDDNL